MVASLRKSMGKIQTRKKKPKNVIILLPRSTKMSKWEKFQQEKKNEKRDYLVATLRKWEKLNKKMQERNVDCFFIESKHTTKWDR